MITSSLIDVIELTLFIVGVAMFPYGIYEILKGAGELKIKLMFVIASIVLFIVESILVFK